MTTETIKKVHKVTPLMRQYFAIKEQHPDTILFFQVGDFYELFFDDAKMASSFLAIALTKRGKHNGENIPLCGVPVHALNHYLSHKSKIVRVSALEALTDLAQRNKSIIKEVTKTVRFHAETGSPAVQARGRKLLKRLQSP